MSVDTRYVFNMCSVINHQDNPFFERYPNAKMDSGYRPNTSNYHLVPGEQTIINGFCQLFPGKAKYHTDNPNLRLGWFENTLEGIVHRINNVTSIAFPCDLDDNYLLKIENFAKRYYLTHNIKPVVKNYAGMVIVDLERRVTPRYFHQNKLVFEGQRPMSFEFPFHVTRNLRLNELGGAMESARRNRSSTVQPSKSHFPEPQQVRHTGVGTNKADVEVKGNASSDEKTVKEEHPSPGTNTMEYIPDSLSPPPPPPPTSTQVEPSPSTGTKVVRKVRILRNKYMDLFKAIETSWQPLFHSDDQLLNLLKPINDHLVMEINEKKLDVLPHPYDLTFNCFNLCRYDDLKAVILGQDPYYANKNEAMGLSFSVRDGVRIPPSLVNIFKELSTDVGDYKMPEHGNLTKWAQQGVLLLNTSMTVVHKVTASHMDLWKKFTNEIIRRIATNTQHVVFLLWGSHAKSYRYLIPADRHLVLESVHPSPNSALKGWFGNKHFSKTNEYLQKHRGTTIDWNTA